MSGAERGLLILPGRGAYTDASLGSLDLEHRWVVRADELRAARGLPALTELDAAPHFDPRLHLQPVHAAPLVFVASLLDAERAANDHHIAAVTASGQGWYTALAATGVLGFDDAFALVQELGRLQQEPLPDGGRGGQVIYPLIDGEWHPDHAFLGSVEAVLRDGAGGEAGSVHPGIDLGGFTVLAADDAGVDRLLRGLPPVRVAERLYPLRLALQGPDHSPLVSHIAAALRDAAAEMTWDAPQVTLIDGRGARWTPWSTDPRELHAYSVGEQLTTPFRFAAAVRVALREEAPDRLILTGPGSSLAGICGQVTALEGYQGIRNRADFEGRQARDPLVLSMRR